MCENLIPLKFEAYAVLETFELLQCWNPELLCVVNLERVINGIPTKCILKQRYFKSSTNTMMTWTVDRVKIVS